MSTSLMKFLVPCSDGVWEDGDKSCGAEQVSQLCQILRGPSTSECDGSGAGGQAGSVQVVRQPLSEEQRLQKVIVELIETEQLYVKDLNTLIERYLEPLKAETFLSSDDVDQLFGNMQEIIQFQRLFQQSIEEAVELDDGRSVVRENIVVRDDDLRKVLISLAASFLYYAHHFKVYSSFCASHSKAQKLLDPDNNAALREFLRLRNPKQQHSSTLESYLIKPIQRIVRYPLLLRQLRDLTDPQSDEHHRLGEALKGMEAVAEHINEMQKIYEEYGCYFEEIVRVNKESRRGKIRSLDVGELQMYGSATWANALNELGKLRKGTQLVTILFVFKVGIVILSQEKSKGRKKPKSQHGSRGSLSGGDDVIRYLAALPVDEVQARSVSSDSDEQGSRQHGLWELIHSRPERDGARRERVYQFVSSKNAKQEFLRTIHHTIRDSLRRLCVPSTAAGARQQQQQATAGPYFATLGNRSISVMATSVSTQRSGGQRLPYDGVIRCDDARHSIGDTGTGDLCTRSRTLTDLNQIGPDTVLAPLSPGSDGGGAHHPPVAMGTMTAPRSAMSHGVLDARTLEAHNSNSSRDSWSVAAQRSTSPNASESTLSSGERGSARLIHSSQRAEAGGSSDVAGSEERPGSPIWKPRSYRTSQQYSHDSADSYQQRHVNYGGGQGSCSDVSCDEKRFPPPTRSAAYRGQQADC